MQDRWKLPRYAVEYAGFRLIAAICATLPIELASGISGWLWRNIAPFFERHRRALAHLRLALPETSEPEREAIARAMWEQLGRTFAEFFHLHELAQSDRIEF